MIESRKMKVAILGSGNIGTDLMYKLRRSPLLELTWMAGIVEDSDGLRRAGHLGYQTTHRGLDGLLEHPEDFDLVFDATTAYAHQQHAPRLAEAKKIAVDLTPAAVGPYVVPVVNSTEHIKAANVNLVTCGGQAAIPIVTAIRRAAPVEYAEIVSTVSSKSAGPGTRQNIDEFTQTTARGLENVGGAEKAKAIVLLNPADPPIIMRNTVYARVGRNADENAITASVNRMVDEVRSYVLGYQLKAPVLFDTGKVTVLLEIAGAGDYFPPYAGNLDIMTAAAVRTGEAFASASRSRQAAAGAKHAVELHS